MQGVASASPDSLIGSGLKLGQDPPPEGLRESGNFIGPFDAATKDPKAHLQAILKGGGGLGLAFKLMKSSLIQHVKTKYV